MDLLGFDIFFKFDIAITYLKLTDWTLPAQARNFPVAFRSPTERWREPLNVLDDKLLSVH